MSKKKFTLEQKLRILAWIDEGHRLRDAAIKFDVNERTILRWHYEARGTWH